MFELKVASLLIFSWCERQLRVCLFGIKLNQCNAMHHCNVMMQDSVVLWLTFLDIFDVDISLKKKTIWVKENLYLGQKECVRPTFSESLSLSISITKCCLQQLKL